MNHNSDGEGELSEQEKQGVFQDLLSGTEYVVIRVISSVLQQILSIPFCLGVGHSNLT